MATPATNALMTALATQLATAAGCAGFSDTDVDFIPAMSQGEYYGVLLSHTGTSKPGSWEELAYTVNARAYIERIPDAGTVQKRVNTALDALFAALRSNVYLGGAASQAVITTWDTSRFYEVGKTQYQALEFKVRVEVMSAETYS